MIYLLDVNVLLGYAYKEHKAHSQVAGWINHIERTQAETRFATCAIVELGFVRVVARRPGKPLVTSEEVKEMLEDFP